ncbi:hypothetical protein ACHQM5_022607 [Ranunculus cassubicifolius]
MASSVAPEGRREPFLHEIAKHSGLGFAVGAIGGSIWRYSEGFLRPETGTGRLSGGFQNMRMKAPLTAGSWGVFSGVYIFFDGAAAHLRQKEDPFNNIIASFATGGLIACRRGLKAAAGSSLTFGLLGIFIEGAMILANNNKMVQKGVDLPDSTPVVGPQQPELQRGGGEIAGETEGSYSHSPLFGSLFGGGARNKVTPLESFDSPSTPIPSFQTL